MRGGAPRPHRVLRGPGLSPEVSDTDPHAERARVVAAKPTGPNGEKTARVLNEFQKRSHEILVKHEVNKERVAASKPVANIVLTRGAGVFPHISMFPAKYDMKAAAVAGVALIKGICRSVGLVVVDVPGATGGLDSDFAAKGAAATQALATHDFVLLSVKAPDLCGHDGKPMEKVKVLERIDKGLMGHLRAHLPPETIVAVTGDHSTPCERRGPPRGPVPPPMFGERGSAGGGPPFYQRARVGG